MAVERARRRRGAGGSGLSIIWLTFGTPVLPTCALLRVRLKLGRRSGGPPVESACLVDAGLCYDRAARRCGRSHDMPNIKQQEKRVRIAARQRLENLRYRSTIRT